MTKSNKPIKKKDKEIKVKLSDCCSSPPEGMIVDGIGRCSRCKEYANFDEYDLYIKGL